MPLFSNKPDALSSNGPTRPGEAIFSALAHRFHDVVERSVDYRVEAAIVGAGFGQIAVEYRADEERTQAAAAQALHSTVDFVPEPADMQGVDVTGAVDPAAAEMNGPLSPQLAALGYTTVNQNQEELS